MLDLDLILTSLGFIVPVILVIITITQGYTKAPSDHAYIIPGLCEWPRAFIGRVGIKIPFFEQPGKLYLGQVTVDIKTDEYILTNDFTSVVVNAAVRIRVAGDDERMKLVMRNSLNKESANITADLWDPLQGNMRETIGTLTLRAINTDRDPSSDQVMIKASKDMERLGTDILSCNIQNVTDEHGLIQDLGMDNTSKIRKDAPIAEAKAERDIAIARATANNVANDARAAAETEIAQENNELTIKKVELQKASDTKKVEADAAYEIQKQEQQKTIRTAMVNVQIARAERGAELCKQEVLVQQQVLETEINKKANADRYAIEQAAATGLIKRQHEAEVEKYKREQEVLVKKVQTGTEQYEREKDAEAQKAIAEAQRYSMVQEVEGTRVKGEAEAAAIRAKALAETEGMEKKVEAYQRYNKAAMAEMMTQVLPDITGRIAELLSQIDKVTIIGGGSDSDNGIGAIVSNAPAVIAKLFEFMKETTDVDLAETMKTNTYDAKTNRNVNLTGAPDIIPGSGQKAPYSNPDSDNIQP